MAGSKRFAGKTALITGAASGIGHAVTELFAKEGATVFASDISSPIAPYAEDVVPMTLDVTLGRQPASPQG